MTPRWQDRRSAYNHDWLKNQYLQALGNWARMLADEVEDPDFEARFVREVLPQWDEHNLERQELFDTFQDSMSPSVLFGRPPLSGCDKDTKTWLPNLVKVLWLSRSRAAGKVSAAEVCAHDANLAYSRLTAKLDCCKNTQSVEALRQLQDEFTEFIRNCQRLAKAIECLPSRVEVT